MAKPKKICLNCKGTIPKGRVKHTCSDECANEHSKNMAIKKKEADKEYYFKHKVYVEPKDVICGICTIEFTTDTNRKYCSDGCSADAKRIKQTERAREVRGTNKRKALKKLKAEEDEYFFIPAKYLTRYGTSR